MACGTAARGTRKARPVFRVASVVPLLAALAFAGSGGAARADLVINATFDNTITSLPNAGAIEGAINAAVLALEATVKSNITVAIDFQNTNSGLGESTSGIYSVSYFDFYNHLKSIATSPAQLAALASLGPAPTSETSGNPLNGSTRVDRAHSA